MNERRTLGVPPTVRVQDKSGAGEDSNVTAVGRLRTGRSASQGAGVTFSRRGTHTGRLAVQAVPRTGTSETVS